MPQKRFSLIELLVVLVVIGILLTLLLPVVNKGKKSAEGAVCKNNLSQLYRTSVLYADDNDGILMYSVFPDSSNWRDVMVEDYGVGEGNHTCLTSEKQVEVDESHAMGNGTYSANRSMMHDGAAAWLPYVHSNPRLSGISRPENLILFGDGKYDASDDVFSWTKNRSGSVLNLFPHSDGKDFNAMVDGHVTGHQLEEVHTTLDHWGWNYSFWP